jgi:hypothetical protein
LISKALAFSWSQLVTHKNDEIKRKKKEKREKERDFFVVASRYGSSFILWVIIQFFFILGRRCDDTWRVVTTHGAL